MPFNPQHTFVHLSPEGVATQLPGGQQFWSLPASEMAHWGQSWLVTEFECASDWPTWEMHPNGDEFVYLLSGSIALLLELPERVQVAAIDGSGAIVIPRGVWHTAKVYAPSRMLHVTLGAGTVTRPVVAA